MKRRTFLIVCLTAISGGILLLNRLVTYWQTQQRIAALPVIPTLPAMPTPIPRSEWDARPVNHDAPNEYGFASEEHPTGWYTYPDDLNTVYHTLVIHHTALARQSGETMRSIQDVHMDNRGWADIGYHFGIDADGLMYAGRDLQVRGASVAGGNTGVIGVVVMGNFEWEPPADTQLSALQTLVNWLAQSYTLTYLAGHDELNDGTVCPGRFLKLYLDSLARGAGLQRLI